MGRARDRIAGDTSYAGCSALDRPPPYRRDGRKCGVWTPLVLAQAITRTRVLRGRCMAA